jgi:circadian clock protein KaiC
MTNLIHGGEPHERTAAEISSLVDTWLLLRDIEQDNERNGAIYVLKSRGMPHSRRLRRYAITSQGLRFEEVPAGDNGALQGAPGRRRTSQGKSPSGKTSRTQR